MALDVLNLLRFKDIADYSQFPELAPEQPITGAEAYDRYLAHVQPFVTAAGGDFLYRASGGTWLLGPADERWDLVLIGRHQSAEAFQALMQDPDYLAGLGHRTAAVEDGRALVLSPGMSTYLVTGAASGMGQATTALLREQGHTVVTVDRSEGDIAADLGTPEGRTHVVEQAPTALDGVVTCAGLAGLTGRQASPVISVNYFGTVDLLTGLLPTLSRSASVVTLSSNSATIYPGWDTDVVDACLSGDEARARELSEARDSTAAYAASKAAIARWTRRTAPSWAEQGIRLNTVMPGLVETPMSQEIAKDEEYGPAIESLPVPLGRPGKASEIAALISFLLSDQAGFFVGSVLLADGGTEALMRPDDWPSRWG